MNINKNVQGHLFALTANVMWGLMAPIGKFALQEFSALSVTTFRMVGAAAAFWILSIFCKQEYVNHKDMLKIFFASLFALVPHLPHRRLYRNNNFAYYYHDRGSHLSERAGHQQESSRYLCRSDGGIDINIGQPNFRKRKQQYLGRPSLPAGTA